MENTTLRQIDQDILTTVWLTDESYRNLAYLCDDIGHRYPGSKHERDAAEFLANKMEQYGLANVHLEEFPVPGWERGHCTVRLEAPIVREISAIALPFCCSSDFEAEVIDVGEGEEADFAKLGDAVRGKIVLTDAETGTAGTSGTKSHRSEKFARAIKHGAVACAFINQNPGLLHITGSGAPRNPKGRTAADRESPIPGIGITYEEGMLLRRISKRGALHLSISTENRTFESTSHNVIGDLVGKEIPDEIVVIGGHYDCHDIAQGAGDDGAGTITGLEAGRALAGVKGLLKRTVRVICFGAEEITLRGSSYHAAKHVDSADGERYRFILNLDGAGLGRGSSEEVTVSALPEVAQWFEEQSRAMHYAFPIRDTFVPHSDHLAFALRGVPTGMLNSRETGVAMVGGAGMVGRGFGHTEADTLDKVCLRGLQMSAILVARLAARLANDDGFPGRRRSIDEVRAQLQAVGTLRFQEQAGRFPPTAAS